MAQIARRYGHARCDHPLLGGIFEAHRLNAFRLGADPDQARIDYGLCEPGVFGQKAIARMHCLSARFLGRGDDLLAHQITLGGRRGTDMHRLVCAARMQSLGIRVRIDRDRCNAHGLRRAHDAAGDLSAIGDQKLCNHSSGEFSQGSSMWL